MTDSARLSALQTAYADEIGENWPELHMKDNDSAQMVICGICGTRFVEYVTANRLDENDRTPEVLIADLKLATDQLWGRREGDVPGGLLIDRMPVIGC
ncbi:hypothetical protein I6F14_23715 [Bradyrhizobium sp. IC3069]|uniref:hypothetical protein n=1 Tax=unclassified Bradyrhizobium TaxID=2631580 RepID=UPI001CD4FBC1|nr:MULTISPECIES: hypothetical protein [unclassified Bradyrhizobium]MCA1363413.1 hypothetical protein [Bradyrhizobium sp. IC4059]MCA1520951.1 hypothetical protein [Bradyrhizobium sp. IC3069]